MSSFRLKPYFKGSFQLSVSILTNILQIFLQYMLRIRMIQSSAKHKESKWLFEPFNLENGSFLNSDNFDATDLRF